MATVNVAELHDRLNDYLTRARDGEQIAVIADGQDIAISTPPRNDLQRALERLAVEGIVSLNGTRSAWLPARVRGRGQAVAATVIEDRR